MKCRNTPGVCDKAVLLTQGQGAKRGTGAHDPLQDVLRWSFQTAHLKCSIISQYCHCDNQAFNTWTLGRDMEIRTSVAEIRTSLVISQVLASEVYCVWFPNLDIYPEM